MGLMDRGFARLYPLIIKTSEDKWLRPMRAELVGHLEGDVLEIGAGSGLNLPHYGPGVSSLTLTEASEHMLTNLRKAAGTTRPDAQIILSPAESLPVPDDSVDHVVSTLVLCSVSDPQRVLSEVRRVLRSGGTFHVIEHVAGDEKVLRQQRRAEPVTRFLGRGCHVTRNIRSILERAGFDTADVADYWSEHEPKIYAPHIVGTARPS